MCNYQTNFTRGMIKLCDGRFLFHMLHSKPLAMLLSCTGSNVPIPLLFRENTQTLYANTLPLYSSKNPKLSIIRLIISTYPYVLNSSLVVGYCQNNILIVHKSPVISCRDYVDAPIKISNTLMICSTQDMLDAKPVTHTHICQLTSIDKLKVVISEDCSNYCNHVSTFSSKGAMVLQKDIKPLLKITPEINIEEDEDTTDTEYAELFFAIKSTSLRLGQCPASSFNTIITMSKSQNNLNLFEKSTLTPIQTLFIKHVLLKKMGLENCITDFQNLYNPHLSTISESQLLEFKNLVVEAKGRVEDIMFALNSISQATFSKPVLQGTDVKCVMLMEKYFWMFPPIDPMNSIHFAAAIVKIICQGVSFTKLTKFLSQYMILDKGSPNNNMLKIYALLTS
ncbi:hypothetical protein KM481_gp19 [Harp seal herpesvirus]|uniref:Tegument protein UL88 n=1 Tax=phocid gammaherpesvirus 3 TaxID=2560643 RepID=A0A0R5Z6F2_9GAMA|nr:hypothetical protein KM481_gp19 [Harp seal herpesvirus]AJG42949.1 hypothetical protein [Harp seal herpesvirus]